MAAAVEGADSANAGVFGDDDVSEIIDMFLGNLHDATGSVYDLVRDEGIEGNERIFDEDAYERDEFGP